MGGSSSGFGGNIAPITNDELKNKYDFQFGSFDKRNTKDPLLSRAFTGVKSFWDQLPQITGPLWDTFKALPGQAGISQLEQAYQKNIAPTIAGGGYSPEIGRYGAQLARTQASATGTTHDNSALINEYQTSYDAKQKALNTALGQGSTIRGQEQQIAGGQATAGGNIQSTQGNALSQLLGVGNAAVSQYTGLTGPMVQTAMANLQSRISGAQIGSAESMNNKNNTTSLVTGVMSAIGSVAGAAAMSDERLKKKIKDTGLKDERGVPFKTFEYKTRPGVRFVGRMAQDIEKRYPHGVITELLSGVKMVRPEFAPVELEN